MEEQVSVKESTISTNTETPPLEENVNVVENESNLVQEPEDLKSKELNIEKTIIGIDKSEVDAKKVILDVKDVVKDAEDIELDTKNVESDIDLHKSELNVERVELEAIKDVDTKKAEECNFDIEKTDLKAKTADLETKNTEGDKDNDLNTKMIVINTEKTEIDQLETKKIESEPEKAESKTKEIEKEMKMVEAENEIVEVETEIFESETNKVEWKTKEVEEEIKMVEAENEIVEVEPEQIDEETEMENVNEEKSHQDKQIDEEDKSAENSSLKREISACNSDSDTEPPCKKIHTEDSKDVSTADEESKTENPTDKPAFMHIDTEKEQDKGCNTTEQDEVAVDPIGESSSDWTADDAECIIPDTNQNQEHNYNQVSIDDQSVSNINETTDDTETIDAVEYPEWDGKYVVNLSKGDEQKQCMMCNAENVPKYTCSKNKNQMYICSEECLKQLKEQNVDNIIVRDLRVKNFSTPVVEVEEDNFRSCGECGTRLTSVETFISWECLEFCEMKCLRSYQKKIGSFCASCKNQVSDVYLGKYCVRFGFDVRQFCCGTCLTEYKKGLKSCLFCRDQMEIPETTEEEATKSKGSDFCSKTCRDNYINLKEGIKEDGPCSVCHKQKLIEIEFTDKVKESRFCSEPCFKAFKYVNNISPVRCGMCTKYYYKQDLILYMVNSKGNIVRFCSRTCQNVYININRKIISCCWCKVKKYNFDMIQKFEGDQCTMWCSLNCQVLYDATSHRKLEKRKCNTCSNTGDMIYHITTNSGLKSYCSYKCIKNIPCNQVLRVADINAVPSFIKRVAKKSLRKQSLPAQTTASQLPIITSVRSLANEQNRNVPSSPPPPPPQEISSPEIEKPIKYVVVVRPPEQPEVRNVMTSAKAETTNAETSAKVVMVDQETQTDLFNPTDIEVLPVPVYIPQPIHMFNFIDLKPIPFPLPIPVPMLIPMTKTGTSGILKEFKTSQPTPSDPYEQDLLVMAQLVADADDKEAEEDQQPPESETEDNGADETSYSPESQEPQSTAFGDDVLQFALNINFTEPAVDLEGALTANTITANTSTQSEETSPPKPVKNTRGSRRRGRGSRGGRGRGRPSNVQEPPVEKDPSPEPPSEPAEKPDANMCLKYTFGVNAWKQWVTNKNQELEKTSRRVKLFKTDLLQLTSDELNFSLCLFIKEVRKPNGSEYAPDTIYYLCLGIQQYLFENGRIDNIFCDPYYESFTDSLDEICKKFSTLYNDSQYIVTRVEEEHLWESKQLGAHSPHVLLSTLMFFNTKHFNLTNVEEHMQLSFSHIMKHWKRVPNTPGTSKNTSSRNILLRFYPPQTAVEGNRKKKVYEQQENEENPIRCPVKLYEFYLSKCPESVKTRNDVFYLQPERSCVPDSPVWYSTMALGKDGLEKMLHRVKMVKEINVALLST
nr:zinc finger MYM-type protein 3-like [Onthophagus taurus]